MVTHGREPGKNMKLFRRLNLRFTLLRIPQLCEACGRSFACEIGLRGCWCSQVKLSETMREAIRAKYRRCVCRACLENTESETRNGELQD